MAEAPGSEGVAAIKLSGLEADLLVRLLTQPVVAGLAPKLSADRLLPKEKAACKRLVKKGFMRSIYDVFFEATDAGRERATTIY